MKVKNVVRILTVLALALAVCLCFAACKGDPDDQTPTNEYLVKDGASEYKIVYGASNPLGGRYAYSVNEAIRGATGIKLDNPSSDSAAEGIKEILLGDTNRQLSKDLKADLESKTADDSFIWGFAYRNGQFAFYFNNQMAFDRGLEQFKTEFLKDGSFVVASDTWITNELTLEAYNAELAAEEERLKAEAAAKKEADLVKRLEAITAEIANATYKDADFGATDSWLTDYAMPTDKYEPTVSITEEHPRVLLTKDTIPKIKALLEDPEYENMVNSFWALADSENFTGIMPEKTHTTKYETKNGTIEEGYETYRFDGNILMQIEARAMAYLLTGKEVYALEAIHGIKNAMLTYKFTVENHMDVYHGPSQIMIILAEVYDWCYDVLTEQDKKQLISGCVYLLIEANHFTDDDFVLDSNKPSLKSRLNSKSSSGYGLEFNFPPNNMNAINGHGTGPQFLRDYMMVTVAFCDEVPTWWDYVGGRFCEEYLPAAKEIYKNGYVTQGTSCYAPIKLHVNLVPAYLLKTATGTNPYPDYIAKCSNFMLSHLMPNNLMFETGDGPRTGSGAGVVYVYFYYFAALYNDTFSLQAAKTYSNNFKSFQHDTIYTNGPAAAMALCAACDKASGNYPDDMPLYTYTETPVGQTTARNSWESDAAVVFMKVGEITMANHDLIDSGTFQIYYKGFLAVTSGNYGKYGSDHHNYYLQKTISANGLLIYNPAFHKDGNWYSGSQEGVPGYSTLEQWQSGKYNIADVTGVANKAGEYSYLAGDITRSYHTSTIDYVGRRMLTVFTGDAEAPMMFFVFDSITSDSADFKKSFLLHTVKEPTVSGTSTDKSFTVTPDQNGKMTATIVNGEGALVLQNVYGGDYMHKIGGDGYAYWIGNENEFDGTAASGFNAVDKYNPSDNDEKIWGRIEITTRGEKKSDMLNVMYVTDSGAIKSIPAVLVEDTEGTVLGATLGDTTAMFVRSESRTSEGMTFTTSGEGTMKYFISGLYAGTWKVSINGGAARNVKVTEDGGLLYFTGKTGTVTIAPGSDIVPEGFSKIEYVLNGGELPAGAPDAYEEGKALTLPIPTQENGVFLGWYTDANYTNKITEIPATATKTFKIYAKFFVYDVFADLDYSDAGEESLTLQNDPKSNEPGVAAKATLQVDADAGCLVWNVISGTSKLHKRSTPYISEIDSEDHALTYIVTLSREPGKKVASFGFNFQVSNSSTNKEYGATSIFTVNSDGDIFLGGDTSHKIGQLPVDGSKITLKYVVDFDGPNNNSDKATFTAYDASNNKLDEIQKGVPSSNAINDGVDTMYKWSKWLSTYQVWFICQQDWYTEDPSYIRIHDIYSIESDIISNPLDLN